MKQSHEKKKGCFPVQKLGLAVCGQFHTMSFFLPAAHQHLTTHTGSVCGGEGGVCVCGGRGFRQITSIFYKAI